MNTEIPDKFSLDGIAPNMIEVKKLDKALLTIHADGRITVSEDLKPTETAAEVLKIMQDMWLSNQQVVKIQELHERIKRLRDGIAKQNLEIEQTCGKVLDYPWFKDDQKNFPDTTENDGVCVGDHVAETIVAELARKYTELKQRIKRLEEALAWYESTVSDCNRHGPKGDVARDALARDQGRKAKEAKL